MSRSYLLFFMFFMVFCFSSFTNADTFFVTTTADTGTGSLRWAIQSAEAEAGADTVAFNIPDSLMAASDSVWVIEVLEGLPPLAAGGTVINGTTQTDTHGNTNSAGPEVVVFGRFAIGRPDGFSITSANNVIRGLVVVEFGGYGISISGADATNNFIVGNYIGVGADGQSVGANFLSGIALTEGASVNTIGSTNTDDGNVISGNGSTGIYLAGANVTGNTVAGNFVGTSSDGTAPVPNGWYGVFLEQGASQNTIGPFNVISSNSRHGVVVSGSSTIQNVITRNAITNNGGSGIINENGGNAEMNPPVLLSYEQGKATFTTLPNAIVEVFSDPKDEGANFEDAITADASGTAVYTGSFTGINMTATARDDAGNTSQFSAPHRVAPFVVTHTGDSGEGSLRWAIENVNNNVGPDSIHFEIPNSDGGFTGTTWVIQPVTPLPPFIDPETVVDGFSQTKFSGDTNPDGPEIVLDGLSAGLTADGLILQSADNVVQGLSIVRFNKNGIIIVGDSATENWVRGNLIGINADGETPNPNGGHGVRIEQGANNNLIGGDLAKDGNVISGNKEHGVAIDNADQNKVEGNFIGTDISGTTAVGNKSGVAILFDSQKNVIGGATQAKGNVICGNTEQGILITGALAKENLVSNNFVGTDTSTTTEIPNVKNGIAVMSGASNNVIGPANTVMYNKMDGVTVMGEITINNTITRNSITKNKGLGISIFYNANNNIEPPSDVVASDSTVMGITVPNAVVEVFSDNAEEGRKFEGETQASDDGSFVWVGNSEGPSVTTTVTDQDGNTSAFSQPYRTMAFMVTHTGDSGEGSLRDAIAGANAVDRPDEIHFDIPTSDPNFDSQRGVWLIYPQTPLPPLKGGYTVIDGRTQSQNRGNKNPNGPEIVIDGSLLPDGAKGFQINSRGNEIRGICIGNFSGNAIVITNEEADSNSIVGNYIGIEPDGSGPMLNNGWAGVAIITNADSNFVGGRRVEDRNVIGGFKQHGVLIFGDGTTYNKVIGNFVGVDPTGMFAIPNHKDGIHIERKAKHNQVGGKRSGEMNLTSGNLRSGIRLEGVGTDSNLVIGNWAGVNITGADSIHNGEAGVVLAGGAALNIIGGLAAGEGNLITGNHSSGMQIRDALTHDNVVLGNVFGLDVSGTKVIGNAHHGIYVFGGAYQNQIGPENVLCGNGWMNNDADWAGVSINHQLTQGNLVVGNFIGTDRNGTAGFGNVSHGVFIQGGAHDNVIGEDNVIAYNHVDGIRIKHNQTIGNTITKNSIFGNGQMGIRLMDGGNGGIEAPVIEHAKRGRLFGTAPPNSTVEVFEGNDDQGKSFLITLDADADGYFEWQGDAADSIVTATATDAAGNTSEFSPAIATIVETLPGITTPLRFALKQNYPNPFNPSTTIKFDLPQKAHVTMRVFNIRGDQVTTLVDQDLPAGRQQIIWSGLDNSSRPLPSGTYFYSISAGDFQAVKKMVYLK